MILPVNSQVTFIELEENDVNRRYITPNFENVEGKVLAVIGDSPKVHLIRTGYATILSAPDTDTVNVTALQAVPSTVDAVYTIQIAAHPVLGTAQATARFSSEFTQLVGSAQPQIAQVPSPVTVPAVPAVDLTAQLKAQMLERKQAELNAKVPADPITPTVPVTQSLPGQTEMKFEDFVAKKQAEKEILKPEINKALQPRPSGKIDLLMQQMDELFEEVSEIRSILSEMRSGLGV